MFNLFFLNFRNRYFLVVLISILSIQNELILINKLFFILLTSVSFFFNNKEFKYKSIFLAFFSLFFLFIELIIENYIFSKEYFINIIVLLLIFRFADLNSNKKKFSFSLISLIVCVVTLINSQDIFNSLISFAILIFTIINLYLINQSKVVNFDIKNLINLIGYSLLILPIIAIVYLIFPRTEIDIKLLDNSNTNLGIPNEINLGSFQLFADSSSRVFLLNNDDYNQKDLYFRVKVFDFINKDKTWISTKEDFLLNKYKDQINKNKFNFLEKKYEIILENHNHNWIPTLKDFRISNEIQNYDYNDFNQISESKVNLNKKKIIQFTQFEQKYQISSQLKNFYTKLPNSISIDLTNWVKQNKIGKSDEEFLNFIIDYFKTNDFFYNLSPIVNSKNNYSDFFFNSKEGYCEYYAGMFVILSRLANIPSRIVSGYYGGIKNNYGNFYEFTQQDAHAWAEVWISDLGWVRFDPTSAIPSTRVKNNINQFVEQNLENNEKKIFFKYIKNIRNYFTYLDYLWITSFSSYDKQSRSKFLNNLNLNYLLLFFFSFLIYFFLQIILKFNKKKFISFLFKCILFLANKEKKILKSDTPHEAFYKLKKNKQLKYIKFFKFYLRSFYS